MHLQRFFLRVSMSETSRRRVGGYQKWKKSSGFISLRVSFRGLSFCSTPTPPPHFNFSEEEVREFLTWNVCHSGPGLSERATRWCSPRRRMIGSEDGGWKVLFFFFLNSDGIKYFRDVSLNRKEKMKSPLCNSAF
ncbi:hypothetical protein CDAR_489711 [Caerostris darwini]|uniref:Uncharacterized protein n=1 Tax=Caerostris darwini TaxID=1538125 RepID=A0AAV4VJX3_9ARAC|nr:hypothetical protein CDAR_489711 [Caerostris darwini]